MRPCNCSRRLNVFVTLTSAAALVACDDGPTRPTAVDLTLVVSAVQLSTAMISPAGKADGSFERACPAGGHVEASGTSSIEPRDGLAVHRWDLVARHVDCELEVDGQRIAISGTVTLEGEAGFEQQTGRAARLVRQESRQTGEVTVARDGATRTCAFDLATSLEAERHVYRIAGAACGSPVDIRTAAPGGAPSSE